MKISVLSLVLLPLVFITKMAMAHPGSHTLICKAAGAKVTEFKLVRSNGTGWFPPTMDVTIDGKTYNIHPEDEEKNYGETVHDSPLGIIHITATTNETALRSYFVIKAIPKTVEAFDYNGKPVKWNLKGESDECYDSGGKAKFKGVFSGSLEIKSTYTPLNAEIMDCELVYNSGMAC